MREQQQKKLKTTTNNMRMNNNSNERGKAYYYLFPSNLIVIGKTMMPFLILLLFFSYPLILIVSNSNNSQTNDNRLHSATITTTKNYSSDKALDTTTTTTKLIDHADLNDDFQQQKKQPKQKLCSLEEIRNGEWIPITLPRAPYIPTSPRMRCLPSLEMYTDFPFQTYEWNVLHQKRNKKNSQQEEHFSNNTTTPTGIHHGNTQNKNNNDDDSNEYCHFTRWDSNSFCKLLKNETTVAFIGDSLMFEMYSSLVHLLGEKVRIPKPRKKDQPMKITIVCDITTFADTSNDDDDKNDNHKTIYLIYQRDDFLKRIPDVIDTFSLDTSNLPTILIINRGAHYVPDDILVNDLRDELIPQLHQWYNQCSKKQQNELLREQDHEQEQYDNNHNGCYLFYKTTVPGHPKCEDYITPSKNRTQIEKQLLSFVSTRSDRSSAANNKNEDDTITNDNNVTTYNELVFDYHWQDFKHQNDLIVKELNQTLFFPFYIINSYDLYVLRPDIHRVYNRNNNFQDTISKSYLSLSPSSSSQPLFMKRHHQQNKQQYKTQADCLHTCAPHSDENNRLLFHFLKMYYN